MVLYWMIRLFDELPHRIQKIKGVKNETFKKKLDGWLMDIPDTPKINDYVQVFGAESDSIVDQKNRGGKDTKSISIIMCSSIQLRVLSGVIW